MKIFIFWDRERNFATLDFSHVIKTLVNAWNPPTQVFFWDLGKRMVKFGSKMQFSQKDLFYFYTFPKLWCQRSASPYHLRNWPESNADSNLPPGPSYKYIPHWSPKSKRLLLRGEGMVLGIWRHHFWSWPTNTTRATNTLTRCHKVSPHLGNMIHIVFILKFYSVRLLQNGDLFYISFSKLLC